MRILYLCQRVPYPPNRGDKIATYHHIRHLARKHDVAVGCLADGEEDLANVSWITPFVTSVDAIPLSRRRGHLRMLAALATGTPLTLAYFNEPELRGRIRKRIHDGRFDVVVIYSSGMAQFVEESVGVPRVMFFSDLDSLKWKQYAENSAPPLRWVYDREARRLFRYERWVAATFEHSLVCSLRELEDCQRLLPEARVSCISNGVDLEYFRPNGQTKRKNSLVFTGVMDYLPNVDGVTWFCDKVLPLIRAQVPDVMFTICGSKPTLRIQTLQRLGEVKVTGSVPDVRPFLAEASVCVVPLRMGRGIQNKLLEAMAMGLPTTATTIAFAGVDARRGRDLLVADEPAEFAAQVVRLLKDQKLRRRMGQAARAAVERSYSWEARLADLETTIKSVRARHHPRSVFGALM
jgi:sugar transferase (PEP-CTERM/EpsH1 system associated)